MEIQRINKALYIILREELRKLLGGKNKKWRVTNETGFWRGNEKNKQLVFEGGTKKTNTDTPYCLWMGFEVWMLRESLRISCSNKLSKTAHVKIARNILQEFIIYFYKPFQILL